MSASGLITILFTDLVGSTEMASSLGDSAADELRRDHFTSLREAVAATGGTEVKTIGDALMVSYPGAADALAGAATMQRAVERHNRKLGEGHRLAMRIGISAGDATFEDDDWFGTPVVESARLSAAADGGQILVADIVRMLAGSRTDLELRSLGELDLKGLPAPLGACEVLWQSATSGDADIPLPVCIDIDPAFPFAGRADHVERLVASWKETVEGARRAVLVSGEPGIGKTRLVTEVIRIAHERGAVVLWGRCDEELGSPYGPFAEALRNYVAASPPDRVRAELGPLGGELVRIVPELAARVPGLAEPMLADADTERFRLFDSVADLLGEISASHPVVLVLDDVHWADKPSLVLLRHLLRSSTPMRLFVLATYRDTDLDRTHPLSEVLADLRREAGRGTARSPRPRRRRDHEPHGAVGRPRSRRVRPRPRAHPAQRDRGQPVLRGRSAAPPRGVGRDRAGRRPLDDRTRRGRHPRGHPRGHRAPPVATLRSREPGARGRGGDRPDVRPRRRSRARAGPAGDALFDALDEATQHGLIREVPGIGGPLRVRARAHAVGAVRGAHDQPQGAHALEDRRSARSALRVEHRRAPRRARVPLRRRRARGRSRPRRSTTRAAPATVP